MREIRIDDARSKWIKSIKYTDGRPEKMIKQCIEQPANIEYKNTRSLLEHKYDNLHSIVAAYKKEIKALPQFKLADGPAFYKIHNFLVKCESTIYGQTLECS